MSPEIDALPPQTAPLAEKIKAAMARSPDYKTQRALGKALGTDGALIGKWRNGRVEQITQPDHLAKLPRLLKTPKGYFDGPSRATRLAQLEAEAEVRKNETEVLARLVAGLDQRVKRLEAQASRRREHQA